MRAQFTAEQRAAIEDRGGSRLLAANAGSGKTAVMVERFVEAVLRDGVPTGAILALTFTEKAAGELRERLRRRFAELGEHERAREAEAAWVGTIHGFCARVLRAHPLPAGLDPSFAVLDEAAAGRVARGAWDQAVERWAAAGGAAAVDLLAAYGPGLAEAIRGVHGELRSRGERAPRLPVPPPQPPPDPAALASARDAAAGLLAGAGDGVRIAAARRALDACAGVLERLGDDGAAVPAPAALDAARLSNGAKVLGEQACLDYRAAWEAYRQSCADHHARAALGLLDGLLAAYDDAYAQAKADRAALDFEDLQLAVRDLLASVPALRERWSQRFELLMVDEFQDTNRLQLDVLEMLERDRADGDAGNLFAVGDEFQSIYGFRHADVGIFRSRRGALGPERTRRLRANFRSHEELLDVLNGAFAPLFGEGFQPLVAGHPDRRGPGPGAAGDPAAGGELRLFDPDHVDEAPGDPRVELLVTDVKGWEDVPSERLGLELPDAQPWRRAEARRVAARLRELVDRGRRPGEIVVLVRAAASLRLLEQALEEQRLPTYVVGGRGYWSQEQVRDGLAYLAVLANPLDEQALLAVLASPFCGAGADALVLAAQAGREAGGMWSALRAAFAERAPAVGNGHASAWPSELPEGEGERLERFVTFLEAEREVAERLAVEVLLDRAQAATGYDVAVLRRPGGERRLANLRKLMRMARDFERAEGRDLRGFVRFAATQDLSQAREGEAALEGEGLDAVRLMTIHRAKGLEFPVVCVADLGRQGPSSRPRLLVGGDGRVALRLVTLGGGSSVPALGYDELWAERVQAEAEEERRLLYVAMTRAEEHLILSGGYDLERAPAPRPGGPPMDWIVPALAGEVRDGVLEREWEGRPARLAVGVTRLDQLPEPTAAGAGPAAPGTALPPPPRLEAPAVPAGQPPLAHSLGRLSYSSLGSYARCGYRFYLQRLLGLPDVPAPAGPDAGPRAPEGAGGLEARLRGTLVHEALERIDLRAPQPPGGAAWRALAAAHGAELSDEEVADLDAQIDAFAASEIRRRLTRARSVRREAPFALPLEPGGAAPLLHGVVDVIAREGDGALVVDYKTDRLDGADPAELAARAYGTQRAAYALAALADGAASVEVVHLFLERPDAPASVTYAASDTDRLRERLLELASGVLAGRFDVAAEPHRELCGTCPGRRTLCRHPETLTLRAPDYESAGSFSGAGGPS